MLANRYLGGAVKKIIKPMERKIILLEDFKQNKERCPSDGNKIFFTYDTKDGIPSFIKCTYCGTVYDFNGKDGYEERNSINN